MPAWTSPNPYFSTSNPYGAASGDTSYTTTPISLLYQQQEPGVAYTRAIAGWGGGLDPYGRFVQGQRSNLEGAYDAAVATNPNLTRPEFFQNLNPQFQQLWQSLGARGRGENTGLYSPRARWQRWG